MEISNLPREKNIIEFSDEELFLWLKDYIEGWVKGDVGPKAYYDAVKVEFVRRSNEKIYKVISELNRTTTILNIIMIFLTAAILYLTWVIVQRG